MKIIRWLVTVIFFTTAICSMIALAIMFPYAANWPQDCKWIVDKVDHVVWIGFGTALALEWIGNAVVIKRWWFS